MQATPATWQMLLDAGWKGSDRLTALCGGEALRATLAAKILPRVATLWNLYGPTETTIWSTATRIDDAEGRFPSAARSPIPRAWWSMRCSGRSVREWRASS